VGFLKRTGLLLAAGLLIPACNNSSGTSTPVTIPAPPNTLVATTRSTARIDLTWISTSTNEDNFVIERSDDGGATYSQVGTSPRGVTGFSDYGLLPNHPYYYRVAASNVAGKSTYAGPSLATTNPLLWKASTGGPGIRADHTAIFDGANQRMILFGGQDDFFTFYNDTWALDLTLTTTALTTPPTNHWALLGTTGSPPSARIGHSAIYDAANNRMIVFGGEDGSPSPLQNDVYILTLGVSPSWSKPATLGTAPTARLGHTAVYDPTNQRMVVFGGTDNKTENLDCFFLSLPTTPPFVWTPAPFGPIQRTEHAAAYDHTHQQMILFGGLDQQTQGDGSILNDETWSLTLGNSPFWTPLTFSGTPSFREGHTLIMDSFNQRMILFGGDTTFGPLTTPNDEVWALRLDQTPTWVFLSPSAGAPPPKRYGHTAIYDNVLNRMVVYGGYGDNSGFPGLQDTVISDQ
jgi:hypothetical protein